MDPQTMAQMDKVSGLSAQDVSSMDQISGLGGNQAQPTQTDNPVLGGIGQVVRGGSDLLRNVGLGIIPNEAANVYDTINTLTSGKAVSSQQNYGDPFRNRQQEQAAENNQPIDSALKDTAGAAAWMAGDPELVEGDSIAAPIINKAVTGAGKGTLIGLSQDNATPGSVAQSALTGGILGPLLGGLKSGMLTKGGAYNKMAQAAAKGSDINWENLSNKAIAAAENKSPAVQKALKALLAEETPSGANTLLKNDVGPAIAPQSLADEVAPTIQTTSQQLPAKSADQIIADRGNFKTNIPQGAQDMGGSDPLFEPTPTSGSNPTDISSPSISSSQALDLRKELGSRLPNNFFEKLFTKVSPAEQDATNILRRTVSGELKNSAPDIRRPDQLYSLYSKIHGDAPTWAKRIIATELLKHLGGQIPGLGTLLKELPVP